MPNVATPQGNPQSSPNAPVVGGMANFIPDYIDPRTSNWDEYEYVTNPGSLAAAATLPSQILIDAGTDFFWTATSLQADLAGAALTESGNIIPLVTVLINDTGSARNLMSAPTPVMTIAGDGKRPYRKLRPRLIRGNSLVQFTWTNYSAATTYSNLYFVMHGFRRYG